MQLPFNGVVGCILWNSDYKIHLPFKRVTCGTVPPHTTKYVGLFSRVTPRSSYICDPTSQNESHGYFMGFLDFYSIVHSIDFSLKRCKKLSKSVHWFCDYDNVNSLTPKKCHFERSANSFHHIALIEGLLVLNFY